MARVKVLSPLKHNGTLFSPGDELDLAEEYLQELEGTIEAVEEEPQKEAKPKKEKSKPAKEPPKEPEARNLSDMNRTELNELALSLGIEKPEEYQNKKELRKAIREARK